VAPSKLLNDNIPIDHHLSDVNGVVTSNFVIWYAFIFTRITVREKLPFSKHVFKGNLARTVGLLAVGDDVLNVLIFLFLVSLLLLFLAFILSVLLRALDWSLLLLGR